MGGSAAGALRSEGDGVLFVLAVASPFLIPLGLAVWYLYGNQEAAAYYRALDG
jgi:hypothetical protein